MKSLAQPRYALALFILFLLASAQLLAAQVKSFGAIDVGGKKVVITFGRDESEGQDARRGPRLSEKGVESEARRFAQVIRSVGEIARGLRMPEKVHLKVASIAENPAADSFNGVIYVGRTFGAVDGRGRMYTQNPAEMLPVIAHEFGHMIFHENIVMDLEVGRRLTPLIKELMEIEAIVTKISAQVEALLKQNDPRARAQAEKLQAEIAQWMEVAEELGKKIGPLADILDATDAYNEFYADVIAVLFSGKPNSVAKAIHIAMPADGGRGELRRRRSEIRNRQFSRRGVDRPLIVASQHAVFHQVREMIWDEYLQRPGVMQNKKTEVLQGVTRAVKAEIRWMISQPEPPSPEFEAVVRILNKRLADRIRAELSRLN